jgi:hypothetical protein
MQPQSGSRTQVNRKPLDWRTDNLTPKTSHLRHGIYTYNSGSGVENLNLAGRLPLRNRRGMALAAQGMAFIFLLADSIKSSVQSVWPYSSTLPVRVALSVTLGYSGSAACVMLTASPHVSQSVAGRNRCDGPPCLLSSRQESGSQART